MQRRALIVEDESEVRGVIERAVNSAGMEAVTLARCEEAPEFLQEGKFDVVVAHMHEDDGEGISVVRETRRSGLNRRTPVVLISDDRDPRAVSRGFEAGASFFVYKPIEREGLSRLIRATQGIVEEEKRRTRRVLLEARVEVASGPEILEGRTIDVSLNGVLVKAPRTLPLGSAVLVSMYLSERMRPVVARGSVARVLGGNQMGIHLSGLTVGESVRLQELLLPMIPPS